MVTTSRILIGAALSLLAATGCQDLIGLTTGHEGGTGGSPGTTSTTSTGGSTGTAGSGGSMGGTGGTGGSTSPGGTGGATGGTGGTECAPDCVSTKCQVANCIDGECVVDFEPPTKIVSNDPPGDCLVDRCDGAGNIVFGAPDDTDVLTEECAWNACAGGLAGHILRPPGAHCAGGVCSDGGQCVAATCAVANGLKDGSETDVDCGGPCAGCAKGAACLVDEDCKKGFCASGKCDSLLALATTVKSGQLVYTAYRPADNPPWTVTLDATPYMQMGAVGVGFDEAGEAVAVARHGTTEALSARWEAGVWKPVTLWPISGVGESASNGWIPAISSTREGLYLFVQNGNFQHKSAAASKMGVNAFLAVGDAVSPFSGAAATRRGHLSFLYPDGTTSLVERRLLGGKWSAPSPILLGNYADAQPATATLPGLGTLVVATRRDGVDHVLDWVLLGDAGPTHQGTIANLKFTAPAAPPRRISLSARADAGAILAFKTPDGNLDTWIADPDVDGNLVWAQNSAGINTIPLGPDPAVARGVEGPNGPKAELVWVQSGTQALRHARLLSNGTWSAITDITTGAGTSVAIAVP